MRSLYLHIDRVTVEGLSAFEQRRFASILQQQLQQLAESGIVDGLNGDMRRSIQSIQAGELRPGSRASEAASQVAAAIRRSLATSARPVSNATASSRGREAHSRV